MSENQKSNEFIMETLIKISKDVGEIKTKVEGLEKSKDRENEAFEKRLSASEAIIAKHTKDIESLKNADDKKDAKRYRYILALIGAGATGILVAKFPDIIRFFWIIFTTRG